MYSGGAVSGYLVQCEKREQNDLTFTWFCSPRNLPDQLIENVQPGMSTFIPPYAQSSMKVFCFIQTEGEQSLL